MHHFHNQTFPRFPLRHDLTNIIWGALETDTIPFEISHLRICFRLPASKAIVCTSRTLHWQQSVKPTGGSPLVCSTPHNANRRRKNEKKEPAFEELDSLAERRSGNQPSLE
ncbi:hypothetical protein AVEN_272599-1 [Araneus ventricosus]|uniref:Uncharacterized protein n=1 Tax=Araneus ventricosus TaxID=182803 RepID=A0A4Y2GGD2_ARAVE|nr:hypothetical protein AVEN_272599-1 [Araneus ventricosus]